MGSSYLPSMVASGTANHEMSSLLNGFIYEHARLMLQSIFVLSKEGGIG